MTTFKNNAHYAELVLLYMDVAMRADCFITPQAVLRAFTWRFKGGSLREAALDGVKEVECSDDYYPNCTTKEMLEQWPLGRDAVGLARVLMNRRKMFRMRSRGMVARVGTFLLLVAPYGLYGTRPSLITGMQAIYAAFGVIWGWARSNSPADLVELLETYTREVMVAACGASKMALAKCDEGRRRFFRLMEDSRVPQLIKAVQQLKHLLSRMGGKDVMHLARVTGLEAMEEWSMMNDEARLSGLDQECFQRVRQSPRVVVGPIVFRVMQNVVMVGEGKVRHVMGRSDVERLHQMVMAATSALVGVGAQAVSGTLAQRSKSKLAMEVADNNITRIVKSAQLVAPGDEVLVCKGYRRAYTAHLGRLAGPLCREETMVLIQEAKDTAADGVLDIDGFLEDAARLDAAGSLNASKMFKICPAPDVSPGLAMMDRVATIARGNKFNPEFKEMFEVELRTQILRAYIRSTKKRLVLRDADKIPSWYMEYKAGVFDKIPSTEIDQFLVWEGTAEMPEVSPYDPKNWKDSGLGADTIRQAHNQPNLGRKGNMITRLIFDEDCPMPGIKRVNEEHVIKFFVKAEGHKDPARGIFSANLTDRQAQSWMERAVEDVAGEHPSFMIGQPSDVREARVAQLLTRPKNPNDLALYYSFDISGWSAKMPDEPQRISHRLWGDLYGGHLFRQATLINEGAHIYLNIDGYQGWYENTGSNLEGFNGKEMTMVLIALLSLSVRRWRQKVVEVGLMTTAEVESVSALLFAYIDDGLSRIDLPKRHAVKAFDIYKATVIETFDACGFSVEVSKCFPSDRFAIFLNEVYLAGRHVVHGVRAAMGISAEPTERHTTLTERVSSVAAGVRGAVMAGLAPLSGVFLMAYHLLLHIVEWTDEKDPVVLAIWSMAPRAWGGLGVPNVMQLFVSGSGSALEEGVATMQVYARHSHPAKKFYTKLMRTELAPRTATAVLTAPLSARVEEGYMVDSRVATGMRKSLADLTDDGVLSPYATRLLRYANDRGFQQFAEAVVPLGVADVLQEQMLDNIADSHPHSIFSAFARRLEKSSTVRSILGRERFLSILDKNRLEATMSVRMVTYRITR